MVSACASTIDSAPKPRVKQTSKPAIKTEPVAALPSAMKIGLLLPLSGPRAALGQSLQNAAQMAVFDDNSAKIELLPRDTGETPQQAALALQELAKKGVSLVIGPLFAPQVAAIKPIAAASHIPVLALSNDTSLASPNSFILGFSPADQVTRVTDFACAQGSKRFAALIPNGAYGDIVSTTLHNTIQRCAGATLAQQRYEAGTEQLTQKLQETATNRRLFDTIIFAESTTALQKLPMALDGQHIRLLGTALWGDDNTMASALTGGWFAMPDGGDRQHFITSYQNIYGQQPPRLAALAYDAVALAASLQKHNLMPNGSNLTTPSGYMGVDGIFRLRADGSTERGHAVHRLTATGHDILDPAPASFNQAPMVATH